MSRRGLHIAAAALLLLATAFPLHSQKKKEDDKVLLISAKSAQLIEDNGQNYRKVIGPAKFFHNNTYLLCDTALWNVNTNVIDAMGHVRIIQDRTKLSSASLQYIVDENMAKFRGDLVQLEDKDKNTLRTRYLDYNTKDSVAVFQDGAAMKDKDGQVIESLYGTYDSKAHLFIFNDQVNMYMDTTFVKTSRLEYRSDLSTAYFGFGTDMWQDDKMLSANDGWYNRSRELFLFRRNVHTLTESQETWSDSLYYERALNNVELLGNVEVMDTTRNVYALAGRLEYTDSTSRLRMTREPAVMSIDEDKGRKDTLYLGADVLTLRAIRRCDIPEAWIKDSEKRLKDLAGDPVMEYRKKAAEAAAKAAEEAAKNDPNRPPEIAGQGAGKPDEAKGKGAGKPEGRKGGKPEGKPDGGKPEAPAEKKDNLPTPPSDSLTLPSLDSLAMPPLDSLAMPPLDSLRAGADTLAVPPIMEKLEAPEELKAPEKVEAPEALQAPADTLKAPADTLKAPLDTTKVNFIWGSKHVRLFKRDIQMASDSLAYCDLDSLVRLFKEPIFFNEGNKQYASDSIFMVIHNQRAEKAHLLSNAFITFQEDEHSYDQVRGTEMVAYFDSTSALERFDALGGASALFFLEENGALATVNKVEAKMIYSIFEKGQVQRMYYYDNPKNDGYPSVQLPDDERTLKGFRWEPERKPSSPRDVTSLVPRRSQRTSYLARPHAAFKQTNTYFPGYINKVYRDIAIRDSLQVVRDLERQRIRDSVDRAKADSLDLPPLDSLMSRRDTLLALTDSLLVPKDSLKAPSDSLKAPADSLKSTSDSLKVSTPKTKRELTPEEIKAAEKAKREREKAREKERKKAEKEKRKAEKQAALEAKWAEEDRIYEEKLAAKAQKKLDRERAKKLKALKKRERRAQRDRKRYERYLRQEQKRALRQKQKNTKQ